MNETFSSTFIEHWRYGSHFMMYEYEMTVQLFKKSMHAHNATMYMCTEYNNEGGTIQWDKVNDWGEKWSHVKEKDV